MFDISWTEMLVVAVVVIIVVKPADLPGVLRAIGKMTGNVRRMVSDFQRQFNEALKEAEIDQVKDKLLRTDSLSNPLEEVKQSVGELTDQLNRKMDVGTEIRENKSGAKPKKENVLSSQAARKPTTKRKTGKSIPVAEKMTKKAVKKTATERKAMTGNKPA